MGTSALTAGEWARGADMAPRAGSSRQGVRPHGGSRHAPAAASTDSTQANVSAEIDSAPRSVFGLKPEHIVGMTGRDEAKVLGLLIEARGAVVPLETLRNAVGWGDAGSWKNEAKRLVLNLRRFLASTRTNADVRTVREKRKYGFTPGFRLVVWEK